MDLHQLHVAQSGTYLLRHGNDVAGGRGDVRRGHGLGHAPVVLHGKLGVAPVAARAQHDALRLHGDGSAARRTRALDAGNRSAAFHDLVHLRIGVDPHAQLLGAFAQHGYEVAAALLALPLDVHLVPAPPHAADGRVHVVHQFEAVVLHPMKAVQRVVGQDAHELGVALLVSALVRLLIVEVGRILDAEGSLPFGVGGVVHAFPGIRVAAHDVHLLQHDDARTRFGGAHGRCQRSAARAHHAHVARFLDGLGVGKRARGLLRFRHVSPGLLPTVGDGGGEGHGRHRGTADAVDVEVLRREVALLEHAARLVSDVAALVFLVGDVRQLALVERAGDGNLGVAPRPRRRIGARGERCGRLRGLVRAAAWRASRKAGAERGEQAYGEAALDETAAIEGERAAHVARDAGHRLRVALLGFDLVPILDHGSPSLTSLVFATGASSPGRAPIVRSRRAAVNRTMG